MPVMLSAVEVGIDGGSGIIWHPVTQLNSNGSLALQLELAL